MTPTIAHRAQSVAIVLALAGFALVPRAAAQSEDPFARRSWTLQLASHAAFETWNYNISHEEMFAIAAGVTYGIRDGLLLTVAAPLYYIDQRGVDAWMLGVTAGVRGRLWHRGPVTAYWEFAVGISEADTDTPPRGTRFNYLALGGVGATVRIRSGLHALVGMSWVHVSNNGLAGRDRNPDIEAVGPKVGIVVGF